MKMKSVVLVLCVVLSGCGRSLYRPQAPVPVFQNNFLADLNSPTLISAYEAMPEGPAKVARRNAILTEIMYLTDLSYSRYEASFFSGQAFMSTAGDIVALGLDVAAASTGTAHLKSVLAALSGGVTGARASYEKNFFDGATRTTIVQVMRSSRLTQRVLIEAGMANCSAAVNCNGGGYTLEQGLLDTTAYYDAGTVMGALTAISESSSQQSSAARQALRTIRHVPQ
jgi:hypothetical protein